MSITYSLIDKGPTDQKGYTIAGQIVTDGTVGPLSDSNILHWNFTVLLNSEPQFSFSSESDNAKVTIQGTVSSHEGFLYLPRGDELISINGITLLGGLGTDNTELQWLATNDTDNGHVFWSRCDKPFANETLWSHDWFPPFGDPDAKLIFATQ